MNYPIDNFDTNGQNFNSNRHPQISKRLSEYDENKENNPILQMKRVHHSGEKLNEHDWFQPQALSAENQDEDDGESDTSDAKSDLTGVGIDNANANIEANEAAAQITSHIDAYSAELQMQHIHHQQQMQPQQQQPMHAVQPSTSTWEGNYATQFSNFTNPSTLSFRPNLYSDPIAAYQYTSQHGISQNNPQQTPYVLNYSNVQNNVFLTPGPMESIDESKINTTPYMRHMVSTPLNNRGVPTFNPNVSALVNFDLNGNIDDSGIVNTLNLGTFQHPSQLPKMAALTAGGESSSGSGTSTSSGSNGENSNTRSGTSMKSICGVNWTPNSSDENKRIFIQLLSHVSTKPDGQFKPKDPYDIFHMVPGRLTMLNNNIRYSVTNAEVYRRIQTPECLNTSLLGGMFRIAKNKNGGQRLREKMKERGMDLMPGRRKCAKVNTFTPLCEAEAHQISVDYTDLIASTFPMKELGMKIARDKRDDPKCLFGLATTRDFIQNIITSVETADAFANDPDFQVQTYAMRPEDAPEELDDHIRNGVIRFSRLTHTFGNNTLLSSWKALLDILASFTKSMNENINNSNTLNMNEKSIYRNLINEHSEWYNQRIAADRSRINTANQKNNEIDDNASTQLHQHFQPPN